VVVNDRIRPKRVLITADLVARVIVLSMTAGAIEGDGLAGLSAAAAGAIMAAFFEPAPVRDSEHHTTRRRHHRETLGSTTGR